MVRRSGDRLSDLTRAGRHGSVRKGSVVGLMLELGDLLLLLEKLLLLGGLLLPDLLSNLDLLSKLLSCWHSETRVS